MSRNIVELSDGRSVRIRPVSHILLSEISQNVIKQFKADGEQIEPPTYTVTLAGGAKQEYSHTEDTLEYPVALAMKETDSEEEAVRLAEQRTIEAKAEWEKHKDALRRLQSVINEKQFTYAFDEGIIEDASGEAWDGSIPDDWLERQKRYGFSVPETDYERRLWYILRGLLPTVSDQVSVFTGIFALTSQGIQNEQIDAAMKFFRHSMEREEAS